MNTSPRERLVSFGLGANGMSGISIGVEPFCGGLVTGASGGRVLGSSMGDWLGMGTCVQATMRRTIVNTIVRYFILPPRVIFLETSRGSELFLIKKQASKFCSPMVHSGEINLWTYKLEITLRNFKCPFIRVVEAAGCAGHSKRCFWIRAPSPEIITTLH